MSSFDFQAERFVERVRLDFVAMASAMQKCMYVLALLVCGSLNTLTMKTLGVQAIGGPGGGGGNFQGALGLLLDLGHGKSGGELGCPKPDLCDAADLHRRFYQGVLQKPDCAVPVCPKKAWGFPSKKQTYPAPSLCRAWALLFS